MELLYRTSVFFYSDAIKDFGTYAKNNKIKTALGIGVAAFGVKKFMDHREKKKAIADPGSQHGIPPHGPPQSGHSPPIPGYATPPPSEHGGGYGSGQSQHGPSNYGNEGPAQSGYGAPQSPNQHGPSNYGNGGAAQNFYNH